MFFRGMPQPSAGPSTTTTPLRPAGSYGPPDAVAGSGEPLAKRHRSFGADSGSGPSSIASTPYAQYNASPNGPYAQYPATSSGHMQANYYSQQYPSAYGGGYQYPYAQQQQQQQQQYAMSSSTQYRPTAQTDGNSPTYPPPSAYPGGQYPYYPGSSYATSANPYPQSGQAPPQQQQGQQQFSGRGAMADPSNPPQLAPINQGQPSPAYKEGPDQTRGGYQYRGQ